MEEAGKNLIPCIMELGGRNPCIVDESSDVSFAVRKVLEGRFTNSGQICVAPDMVYVHE
jgi:aldehyde dehydrogenase (NAD+)